MSTISQAGSNAVANGIAASKTTSKATEKTKTNNYGRTIGSPELSEKAQKYYEQLKKKYSNMDFILVSKDQKEAAQAQAGKYANANRMVVLIDEEKIERMATDESYRKQYEGIIGSSAIKLTQLKQSLGKNASHVKTFGMQVKDGVTSLFAVVDKAQAAQKKRIEKNAAKRAEEKKEAQKTAEEKRAEKRKAEKEGKAEALEESEWDDENLVTVTASSVEELLRKINDVMYEGMSDNVRTEEELKVGQHFDIWS
jgi:hypothetical protein